MFDIILIILLLIYPYFIAKKIRKIVSSKETIIIEIFKNLFILAASLIALKIAITPALEWFDKLMPSSTSNQCASTTGIGYSCKITNSLAIFPLLALSIVFILHHILTLKYVYNLFIHCKSFFIYILMYLYIGSIYVIDFFVLLNLYGLFVQYKFNLIINILRVIIVLLPWGLYYISYKIKKSKQ